MTQPAAYPLNNPSDDYSQHERYPYDPAVASHNTESSIAAYADGDHYAADADTAVPMTARQRRRVARAERTARRQPASRSLIIRRCIGVALMLAMAAGVFYAIFYTPLLDPVLALIQPAREFISWVREDPSRLFTAAVTIILPHMALYAKLFGDE